MNTKTQNDGDPAFPVCYQHENLETGEKEITAAFHGMSLRDYAVIKFMSALMQREDFNWETGKLESTHGGATPLFIATEHADAMIAARNDNDKKD